MTVSSGASPAVGAARDVADQVGLDVDLDGLEARDERDLHVIARLRHLVHQRPAPAQAGRC